MFKLFVLRKKEYEVIMKMNNYYLKYVYFKIFGIFYEQQGIVKWE